MKRILILCTFILLFTVHLFGGDTARFVNLGFSSDGKYFMFGQHGFIGKNSLAYSDLYLVDTKANIFVSGVVNHGEYLTTIEPGQSSDGALYTLLEDSINHRKKYGISYLEKGRPLYIRISNNEDEENPKVLQFRDFETEEKYTVDLQQTINGEGQDLYSTFYIKLLIEFKDGVVKELEVGHPNFKRDKISDYNINRILLSPGEETMIFIIGKTDVDFNVRYMIETVKMK